MKLIFRFVWIGPWKARKVSFNIILYAFGTTTSQSLDSSAKTMDKQDLKLLKACFSNIKESIIEKLPKGFFPYNFLDSPDKFAKPLPPYGPDWFNTLTQHIESTEQDYGCALELYNAFTNILHKIMFIAGGWMQEWRALKFLMHGPKSSN